MFSWTGNEVGDFVIEEPIGHGGMAVVYAAQQRSVRRQVALKVIDLQDGEGDFLKRFTREAEVIAMLEHIHILPIYGYGVLEGEFAYFAMRLLPPEVEAVVLRALSKTPRALFLCRGNGLQIARRRRALSRRPAADAPPVRV